MEVYWQANGILFRSDDQLGFVVLSTLEELMDFLLRVAVVIEKVFGIDDFGGKGAEASLKALGGSDATEHGDASVFQLSKRQAFFAIDCLEVLGLVLTFNDLGIWLVGSDALLDFLRRGAIGLG